MGYFFLANVVYAKDINLIGVFPGKAVISVNGGPPKTLGLDSGVWEGVRLLAVEGEQAVVEIDGKKHTLGLGTFRAAGGMSGGQRSSVTLQADGRGHFITEGKINGGSIRFMVDTGASMIAIGIGEGSEQNAPLGRAVIGGLLFATVSTLFFVPVLFASFHRMLALRNDQRRALT